MSSALGMTARRSLRGPLAPRVQARAAATITRASVHRRFIDPPSDHVSFVVSGLAGLRARSASRRTLRTAVRTPPPPRAYEHLIEHHDDDDDETDDEAIVERRTGNLRQRVAQHAEHERAEPRPAARPSAAGEAGAADHRR